MSPFKEGEPTPEAMGINPAVESAKDYHEQVTVNGIEISVGLDAEYDDYTIYFPQIELGDDASEKGVDDQVIRLSQRPEVAKQVFEYASQLAQTEPDVYALYKKVEAFAQDLPYDKEE